MNLYVWDEALIDEHPGIVCAYAHTIDEALNLIKQKDIMAYSNILGPPREVNKPEAFIVWGSS